MTRLRTALLLLGMGVASRSEAAEPSVTAYLDPADRANDTQPIRLILRIEGSERPDISSLRLPPLNNLRVMRGPDTANEFRWVNGRSSSSTTLSYVLIAERPGKAEVPPITIQVGEKTYRTEPMRIEIVSGPSGPSPRGSPRGGGPGPTSPGATSEEAARDDVFLSAELGAAEVWVGQPVSLEVTLLAARRVTNFSWIEQPSFGTFWSEEVATDPNAEARRTVVEGRPYQAYPMVRRILVPTASGEQIVGPYTAQLQVVAPSQDFFMDFFSTGRARSVIRKTPALRLRVRPLPEAGRPSTFDGAVGTFRMEVSMDRQEASVNDAVAFQVTLEGEGSLKGIAAPRLEAPPDLKVFEPKVTEATRVAEGKLIGKKTWEWVLVPLAPGTIKLPALRFSFFDPRVGSYRDLVDDPRTLVVHRGGGTPPEAGVARSEVLARRQEVAYIKPLEGRLATASVRLHRNPLFVTLAVLPWILTPVLVLLARRQARIAGDRGLYRSLRAGGSARRRLKVARRRLTDPNTNVFHEEVARALVDYVADRFDRVSSGLSYDLADQLLAGRGVSTDLRNRFRSCLERCDFARFVPDAGPRARREEVLAEAEAILVALEEAL